MQSDAIEGTENLPLLNFILLKYWIILSKFLASVSLKRLSLFIFLFYNKSMKKRLYLKLGDRVRHISNSIWGSGEVVEERHSNLSGGFCFVRILFEDGSERSFVNDLDNAQCCYYSGIRLL